MMRATCVAMFAICVQACGSDGGDDEPGTARDTASATDDGGSIATESCAEGLEPLELSPAAPPDYACDSQPSSVYPDGPNACRNQADCALIDLGNQNKLTALRQIAKNCALSCQGAKGCDARATCNDNCIRGESMKNLGSTLSQACGDCYTFVAVCGLEKCLSECSDDPDTLDCVECSFKSGCRVPFERCSGLDRK
jgi:hypothetical protein